MVIFPEAMNPLADIAREAFRSGSWADSVKARKLEIKKFLEVAGGLLDEYGSERDATGTPTGRGRERITPPVGVMVDARRLLLRVIEITDTDSRYDYTTEDKFTAVQATDPEKNETRDLFGIEHSLILPKSGKPHNKSFIRNHFSGRATNEDVSRGLWMVQFIADELALRPMWDSLNR